MEKYRRKLHRLLTLIVWGVFFALPVFAESSSRELPQVLVETERTVLTVAQPWKLTLLIQYPKPEDVIISPPPIPGNLELDRIRTGIRMISGEAWTAVEYTFIPKILGNLVLGPFEIQIQGKRKLSSPQTLTIQDAEEAVRQYTPRLFWAGRIDTVQTGVPLVLELHLKGYDPAIALPENIMALSVNPVQNALIEPLYVSYQDRARGVLHRIQLIPLTPGELDLPEATVRLGVNLIRSEPRRIMVAEGHKQQVASPLADGSVVVSRTRSLTGGPGDRAVSGLGGIQQHAPVFPESPLLLWPFISGSVTSVLQESRTLWQSGSYAQALAVLRKQERDALAGLLYRRVRKEAEQQLGIISSPDEWWLPQGLLYTASAIVSGMALLWGLKKRKKVSILFLACSCLILVYSMVGQKYLVPLLRGGTIGVIQEPDTAVRTIPDPAGNISSRLVSGEGVLIQQTADPWVFISAPGQRSGWVLRSVILTY